MPELSVVLAHQGGWDEILFVLAPLVLFAILLLMARRRVERMDNGSDSGTEAPATETAPPSPPDH